MLQALTALKQRVLRQHTADDIARPVAPAGAGRPQPLTVANAPPSSPAADMLAATPRDPLEPYAVSAGHGKLLVELLRASRRALDPDYAQQLAPEELEALRSFYGRRTNLLQAVLTEPPLHRLPARTRGGTSLADCRTTGDVLRRLLSGSAGLVIGSAGSDHAGKQLLIDNMDTLRKLGVDTLYLDHLQADLHQADIDRMHRSGRTSADLSRFLAELDGGHMTQTAYRTLVDAADRAGLRVVALELAVSYHLKGAEPAEELPRYERRELRARVFSHVAAARIKRDQALRLPLPGQRRWIALMDATGAGTFNGNAGVAARLGVSSLRVEDTDVEAGRKLRAGFDPGRALTASSGLPAPQLQCDHLLKVPRQRPGVLFASTPEPCSMLEAEQARRTRAAVASCARDLVVMGTFRVVETGPGMHVLVHRSSNGALVAQTIAPAPGGGVRLQLAEQADARRWGHVLRAFPTLDALRAALSTRMEEVPVRVPGGVDR